MSPLLHILMTLADLAALVLVARRPTLFRGIAGLAAVASTTAVLGSAVSLLGFGSFGLLRVLSFGIFVYVPAFLIAAALLLARHDRRAALAKTTLAVVLLGVGIDAFWIEPTWLEVSRHEIRSPRLRERIRVVVLADFHTDTFGDYERRVLDTVMAQQADLVLLPGDYVQILDPERRAAVTQEIRDYLGEIRFRAPLGVLAVRGDVETDGWEQLFAGLPVTTFQHTSTVQTPNLVVTALHPWDSRATDLHVEPTPDRFHIVFGHAPDFALSDVDADLLVAGHTHGGQVRLPGIGPLVTFSRVPRSWAAGRTDLDDGRVLVVSRGTGMERHHAPRMRFLCRPEIVVLDLLPGRGTSPSAGVAGTEQGQIFVPQGRLRTLRRRVRPRRVIGWPGLGENDL